MPPIRVNPLRDPNWHLGQVCSQCEGEGVWTDDPALSANDPSTWGACAPCNATGRIPWGRVECGRCKGSGEILVPEHGGTPCGTDYCPDCFRSPVDGTVPVVVEMGDVFIAKTQYPSADGYDEIMDDEALATLYAQIATLHGAAQVVIRLDSRESVERAGAWQKWTRYPGAGVCKTAEAFGCLGHKEDDWPGWPLPYVFYRVPAEWQALARELGLPLWEEAG